MKRNDIDGIQYLRGIAAMMVVAHHSLSFFPGSYAWTSIGSAGVDIFFVISGFVMSLSTRHFDPDASRAAQARSFLMNRLVRVVPLYWLVLLWTDRTLPEPASALALDYFFVPRWNAGPGGVIAPSFLPGWTINYEMFFYVVFAAAMLAGRLRHVLVAALFLLLCSLHTWMPATPFMQFATSNLLVEFLLGVGLFFAMPRMPRLPRPLLIGFLALATSGFFFVPDNARGIVWGPLAAMVVGSCILLMQGIRIPFLRAAGDASYSIYLFHWPLRTPSRWLAHGLGLDSATPLHIAATIAIYLVIALLGGWTLHHLIEKPTLEFLRNVISHRPRKHANAKAASGLAVAGN